MCSAKIFWKPELRALAVTSQYFQVTLQCLIAAMDVRDFGVLLVILYNHDITSY